MELGVYGTERRPRCACSKTARREKFIENLVGGLHFQWRFGNLGVWQLSFLCSFSGYEMRIRDRYCCGVILAALSCTWPVFAGSRGGSGLEGRKAECAALDAAIPTLYRCKYLKRSCFY